MDRKQFIEKVILKELKDMEFMKKIKNINSINEAKKGKRPVMTGKFGADVTTQLAAAEAENKGYVNPDALPEDPVKRLKVLKTAEAGKPYGGDAMDDKVDADFKVVAQDSAEDAQAREALKNEPTPVSPAEAKAAARLENKDAKILEITKELGKHVPTFSKLSRVKGKTPVIFDTDPQTVLSAIQSTQQSHPHLSSHTKFLKSLLGL